MFFNGSVADAKNDTDLSIRLSVCEVRDDLFLPLAERCKLCIKAILGTLQFADSDIEVLTKRFENDLL